MTTTAPYPRGQGTGRGRTRACLAPATVAVIILGANLARAEGGAQQYAHGEISVPAARADEPKRDKFSAALALSYLEDGALAWSRSRECVSCHTNGSYVTIRPALTPYSGPPSDSIRQFFVGELKEAQDGKLEALRRGIKPTQIAYIARGLAEWDAHVTKSLSRETAEALRLLFQVQSDNGAWGNTDCWPPFESDEYHGAIVAAFAIVAAPGWLEGEKTARMTTGIEKLREYLRTTEPPHDYARVWRLRIASRLPGILTEEEKQRTLDTISKEQQPDGGWSMRSFAAPEAWGRGNRAEKLRAEQNFAKPPSDGHQTGLVLVALREAGILASDPRVKRGIAWLLSNQRASGRWWTRSLNTEKHHFITYSGTALPLLALAKCGAWGSPGARTPQTATGGS